MRSKPYDLAERTFLFAKEVALFCKRVLHNVLNDEYVRQLVRSSGSVGANYIEANESLGKKDFLMKIKTCRREARESAYWIRLLEETNAPGLNSSAEELMAEASELKKIFSSIAEKSR